MAWTTTTDVSAGSVLTATDYNEQVLGNLNVLRGDFATSRATANKTLNSTTWTAVNGPADLTLAAAAGDVVECSISFSTQNEAVTVYFDVATVVSGTVTNYFGINGSVNNSHEGIVGWTGITGVARRHTGNFYYVLQAGDIASSTVTLRLMYRTSSAANRTMFGGANFPQVFFARNHGPVEI